MGRAPSRLTLVVATIASAALANACCDERCIKSALVAEADGGPDALSFASRECCLDCPGKEAVQLPGRCLEVFAGLPAEHRNVDIWDCNPGDWPWQTWRWLGTSGAKAGALQNVGTGRCLHIYSFSAPARLEQSSSCETLWQHTDYDQLIEATTGLCMIVNGTVTGKDKDVNYSVPSWALSGNKEWITYAGKANGARLTLGSCAAAQAAKDGRERWSVLKVSQGTYAFRAGTAGSSAVFGSTHSTCGAARSTQTCSAPPLSTTERGSSWPSWVLANRAATAAERRSEKAPGSPEPPAEQDPYLQLPWLRTSFVETQMMVHDRYFFDAESGKYTVDRYLDDLEARYGGIDAVLMWYPCALRRGLNLGLGSPALRGLTLASRRRQIRIWGSTTARSLTFSRACRAACKASRRRRLTSTGAA